ncbi:MAG: hypothetical protein WCO84_03935 [bacterium]
MEHFQNALVAILGLLSLYCMMRVFFDLFWDGSIEEISKEKEEELLRIEKEMQKKK